MGKVIGTGLDPIVSNQLQVRSDILKKKNRTDSEIRYLNAKTGWIKMSSAVNVNGGFEIAQKNVLLGGTLLNAVSKRQGLLSGTNSSYEYDDNLGYRPMPGITDFSVVSQNTFGTLKKATVVFNCWTLSQLEEMEQLFMRPGFHVLLEWGHSLYYTNTPTDGLIEKMSPIPPGDFFNNKISYNLIEGKMQERRADSSGNYDGMLGVIRNFQWSYRTDGGYDCRTDVISRGDLIGSIKTILFSPLSKGTEEEDISYSRMSKVLRQIQKQAFDNPKNRSISSFELEEKTLEFTEYTNKIVTTTEEYTSVNKNALFAPLRKMSYIRISTIMYLINELNSLKESNLVGYINFNYSEDVYEYYDVNNGQGRISVDPSVCLLNDIGFVSPLAFANPQNISDGFTRDSFLPRSLLGMWVNLQRCIEIMDRTSDPDNPGTVLDFIKDLLKEIEVSIGSINEFDIHFQEENNTYYIIDRKNTPTGDEVSEIIVSGLGGTASNIQLTSKISPNLATMVAIAAQATTTKLDTNMVDECSRYLKWNEGLEDRVSNQVSGITPWSPEPFKFTPVKPITVRGLQVQVVKDLPTNPKRIEDVKEQELDILRDAYSAFIEEKNYSGEKFKASKMAYSKMLKDSMEYSRQYGSDDNPPPGIIPFELSMAIDGIAGIKIGQAFKINKGILPSKMDKFIGFIITGIDHKISNNRWVTNLKAQTFIV